jgi:hypothetical protein
LAQLALLGLQAQQALLEQTVLTELTEPMELTEQLPQLQLEQPQLGQKALAHLSQTPAQAQLLYLTLRFQRATQEILVRRVQMEPMAQMEQTVQTVQMALQRQSPWELLPRELQVRL